MSCEENSGRKLGYKKQPFQSNLNIRNISFCCDGSFILIACKNFIRPIYYKTIYGVGDDKYNIKDYLCENISVMELYPFTDRKFEVIAAYEDAKFLKIFNLHFLKKPEKKSEIKTIPLNYNCLFIQWQSNKNNTFITASDDKKIYIYENTKKIHTINDDDFIKSMKFISIENQDYNILITGYDKKIKIWDFNKKIYPERCSKIIPLIGEIDIIDKSLSGLYILFGSKKNKAIYIYKLGCYNKEFRYNFFLQIDPINFIGEMINANFINNIGIVITYQFKILYYYLISNKCVDKGYFGEMNEYNKAILDVSYVSDQKINFASVMFQKLTGQNFLIYKGEDFMKIHEIFIKNISSDHIRRLTIKEQNQEKILTIFNTIKNRNIEIETKILNYLYHLKIKSTIIEIEFGDLIIKPKISVIECHDSNLSEILLNEIENYKNKDFDLDDDENILISFIYNLNDIIVEFQNDQEGNIDENNEIINITQKDIETFKIFRDWKKNNEDKIPINRLFSETIENQFINIVSSNLRDIINWEFNFEQDINIYFNFIDRNSSDFTSNKLCYYINNKIKKNNDSNNISMLSDDIKFTNNSNSNVPTKSENTLDENKKTRSSSFIYLNYELNENENDNKDDSSNKSKNVKNRQELFNKYISQLKEKKDHKENILLLKDILKQINFYMEQLINEKMKVLKELIRDNILNIILLLEQQSKFGFLFICLIPLSNLIFQEIIKEKDNENLNEGVIIKNNSFSEKLKSDDNFECEIVEEENNKIERRNSKRNTIDTPKNKFLDKKIPDTPIPVLKKKKLQNIFFENSNASFLSQPRKVDPKRLIRLLGNKFVKNIVNFISFFVEELHMINNNTENKDILNFFCLVNKYFETQEIKEEIININNIIINEI